MMREPLRPQKYSSIIQGLASLLPALKCTSLNYRKTYGVLDDQLRPAFQTLITASGDLTASQKALALALDVSAATGKSVEEVSAALAKGFSGQTTALSRLGAGLSKTTLASGDMNKIMEELNKKFAGQATARLSTYAGKMDLLNVYAANASETIGKGLIDALEVLGKDKSIQSVGDSMENLATNIANVTTNLAKMIKGFGDVASNPAFQAVIALLLLRSGKVDILAKLFAGGLVTGILTAPKQPISMEENRALAQKRIQDRIKEAKGIKTAVTYRAAENDALKKKTELDKLKDKFDTERIGLMAALNSATDEETKLRLKAQIAILDNNDALAKKYNAELEAANAAKNLADSANQAANSLRNVYENAPNYGAFRESPYLPENLSMGANVPTGTTGGTVVQNNHFEFKAEGSIMAQDDFTDAVQKAVQIITTNGYSTVPAGFL